MGEYTETAYVGVMSEHIFGRQLFNLVKRLKLPQPYFRGRKEETAIPDVYRWEIRTIMRADPTMPTFETLDYVTYYPEWSEGVDVAMLDLLSRLCYKYREELPLDSPFHAFGKRDATGVSLVTTGNRLDTPTIKKHCEDLDFHANCLARRVQQARSIADHARAVMATQTQELQASHTLIGHMEEHIHDLQLQNLDKDEQIAALQAQLNPPPPPPPEAEEGGGNDVGDGAEPAQEEGEEEEEEDPEEVIFDISSGEEDTPARNTREKKRKRMTRMEYVKCFK